MMLMVVLQGFDFSVNSFESLRGFFSQMVWVHDHRGNCRDVIQVTYQ
jgi:hypothetical protein